MIDVYHLVFIELILYPSVLSRKSTLKCHVGEKIQIYPPIDLLDLLTLPFSKYDLQVEYLLTRFIIEFTFSMMKRRKGW
jgi:hypothetical protein